jgi:hypothetical protein
VIESGSWAGKDVKHARRKQKMQNFEEGDHLEDLV